MSTSPTQAPLVLERVIGCTSLHNAVFAVNPATGDVASAAGCVVTLFCPARNRTVRFVRVAQPVSALAFSADGQRLAIGTRAFTPAGQQTGRTGAGASLSLWSATQGFQLAEVPVAHSEGIAALTFSPDGQWLVSVGFARDRALHVWAVGHGALSSSPAAATVPSLRKAASGRISQRVTAVSFAASGGYFVTAGERHLKFWSTEPLAAAAAPSSAASAPLSVSASTAADGAGAAAPAAVITLSSKPGVMSEAGPEFETFVDVACAPAAPTTSTGPVWSAGSGAGGAAGSSSASDTVYALTSAGMLCAFEGRERLMEHWVSLRVRSAFSLSVVSFPAPASAAAPVPAVAPVPGSGAASGAAAAGSSGGMISRLYAGCSDGIVRVFDPRSLAFLGVLPAPPAVGRANATVLDSAAALPGPMPGEVYPAALAVRAGPPLVHVSDDGSAAPVSASHGAGMKLPVSVIYGDRSLVVWDCAHLERVTKLRCLAAHAGQVWDLAFAPFTTASSSSALGGSLPPGTFATVAGDSTLRLWNLHPRATYSRKEAPAVAAAAAAAAAQRIADADASALTADHPHDDDDAENGDHQGGASASRPATGLRVPSSGTFSDGSQTQLAQLQPPAVLHLLSPSVAAAASSSRSLGASGHHGTSRSGGRSKAPLLPGARPRGVIMKEQLAVLYADAEPEAEAAILAPEADAEAEALGVVPERGRAPVTAYRSGPGVCSLVAGAGAGAGAAGSLALHERPGGGLFAADSWPASAVINEPFNSEMGPVLPHDRGLRCLAFSPDGSHVATGDRVGNVRVFTVGGSADAAAIAGGTCAATSPSAALAAVSAAAIGQCVFYEIAHDAELSTLAFAPSMRGLATTLPGHGHGQTGSVAVSASLSGGSAGSSTGSRLLASGSRDTLVHIFDARCSGSAGVVTNSGGSGEASSSSSFSVAMSLPEHADGVTAVRFSNDDARLITMSSDGAVVFWKVAPAPAPAPALTALHGADAMTGTAAPAPTTAVTVTRLKATKNPAGGVYDATVDATNKSVLAVGAGDGIAVWSLKTGRVIRTLRASDAAEQAHAHNLGQSQGQGQGQVTFLTRVAMDPAGLFVATGASDCSVRLLDFFSGAALARASGHAGLITGVAFAPDCRRLLTASLDGCIFVWRLSPLLTRAMIDRLREMGRSMGLGVGMGMGAATGLLASGPPSCVPQSLASLASPTLGSAATPAAAATAFPTSGSSGSWPQPSPLAAAGASSSGVAGGSDLALTPTTAALVQAACWGVGGGGGGAGATVAPTPTASASATGSATTAAADAVIDARRPGGAALPPRLPSASALFGAGGVGGAGGAATSLGITVPRQGAGSMQSSGASSSHADDQAAAPTPRPTVAAWGAGVGGGSTTSGGGSTGPGGAAVSTRTTSEGLVQGRGHGQGDAGDQQQHGVTAMHVPLPLPSSALSPPPVKISGSPAGSASDADAAAGDVPFEFRESILPAWVRQQQSSWETASATAGADAAATSADAPRPLPFSPSAAVPSTSGGGGGAGRSKWAVMMSQSVANLLPATTATAAAAIAVGADGSVSGPIAAAPPVPPLSSAAARRLAPHAEADADEDHQHHDDGDGDGELELFPPPSGGATLHFHPPPEPVAGALGLGLGAGVGIAAPQEVFTVVSPSRRLPAGAGGTGATDAASAAAAVPALNRALESDDHDADADGAADMATAAAGAGGPGSTTSGFSVGSAGSPFPFASPPGPGSSFGDSPVPTAGSGSAGAAGGSAAGTGIGGGIGGAAMRHSVSVSFMRRSAALSLGPAPTAASTGAGSAAAPGHAAAVPPPAPASLPSNAKPGGAAAGASVPPPATANAAASGLPASRLGASVAAKLQRMSMSAGSAGSAGGGVSRQGSGAGAPAPAGPPQAATTTGIAEASPPRRASTAGSSAAAAGAQSPQFTDLAAAAGQAGGGRGHGVGNAAAAAGNRYLASPGGASTPERTGSGAAVGAGAGGLESSAVSLGDVGVSALLDTTAQAASSGTVGTPARTGTGLGRSPPASASAPMRAPQMVASPQLGLGSRGSVAAGEEDAYINASFDSEPGQERSSVDLLSETAQLQHLLESARRATSAEAVSTAALMHRAAAPRSAAAEAEAALRALQAAAEQLVRLLGSPTLSGPSAEASMPPEAATALRRAAADIGRRLLDAANP